ncbi:MAG: DUF5615 family PIN-like protein [Planctomycetes bacterium]|nr:DUF5615 family PIN-like protein [Planctomycetota bacterium]
MRFLLDRCVGGRLAEWLRAQGHDVLESRERGPDPGDAEILRGAFSEGRVLVTNDKDFGQLVFVEKLAHAGLVRLPDVPPTQRITLLAEVIARHAEALTAGAVVTVRGGRIRVSARPP